MPPKLRKVFVTREELDVILAGDWPQLITDVGDIGGLTPGSIPFADATGFLTEDNAALFWDATNEILKLTSASTLLIDLHPGFTATGEVIKITPSAPLATIDAEWDGIVIDGDALDPSVIGVQIDGLHIDFSTIDLTNLPHLDGIYIQMPSILDGFHAIHLEGELHVDLDATSAVTGETYTALDVVVATVGSTGGDLHVLDVARSGAGAIDIAAVGTHEGIDVIHQEIGTFAAADKIWEFDSEGPTWIDVTAGVGAIWDDKDDLLYVGHASTFSEIKFMFTVMATKNMHFKFYFSEGGAVWPQFFPADDTNGATQDGSVRYTAASLPTWATDTVNGEANKYWIKIERTRTSGNGPTTSSMQQLAPTLYGWDKLGAITALSVDLINTINEFSTDVTLGGDSDSAVPTEKAVKAYVDAAVIGSGLYAFKTITGITNDVVADQIADTLTLASADGKLTIVGTAATDTITFSVIEAEIDHNALTNYDVVKHVGEDHTVAHSLWIGHLAAEDLLNTGQYNTIVGEEAGKEITGGDGSTIVGYKAAGAVGTDSWGNAIFGTEAAYGTAAHISTCVVAGYQALFSVQETSNIIAIGYQAAYDITTGGRCVVIGYQGGKGWLTIASDKLIITNSDTVTPLIYGDFSTPALTFYGSVTLGNGYSLNLQEDITFTGATAQNLIKFPDNLPTALDFREGANSYLLFRTSDGTESVTIGKTLTLSSIAAAVADHDKFLVSDAGVIKFRTGAEVLADIGGLANIVEDGSPQLGGDLDLNGNNIDFPSVANISDCKDEDNMASNSPTMLATQQSIKAYVDAMPGGGDVTAAANIADHSIVRGDGGVKGIQQSTALISDNGEMTNPSQPAFLAFNDAMQNNIANDGSNVTVIFQQESFDQGGNFAANTFTAPVTGKYMFTANLDLRELDVDAAAYQVRLVTTGGLYILWKITPGDEYSGDTDIRVSIVSPLIPMTATDTAYLVIIQSVGGGAQTDIGDPSYFSGWLVC